MLKRVVICHRWGGSPQGDWYPWLARELEARGAQVVVPEFPDTDAPLLGKWVAALKKAAGPVGPQTYFVGHSIGCQAILRLLQREGKPAGGAVFVAGWFGLKGLDPEEQAVADPWIRTPIKLKQAEKRLPRVFALFSEDDPYVPLENAGVFQELLGAKVLVEDGKGHFTGKQLPQALKALLAIMAE
ncbi:MAG: serine hydrolase family protein [Candidatus Aenigmarchaeota archaeon]|nr:serine hydrolase family protein [Candidatus Aenigmarchaeota archaeon]